MQSTQSNLGLYIHIPYCQKKCPYCAFYSEPIAQHQPEKFVDALFMELEQYAMTEPVETIYIGGGSPTCLRRELLVEIVVSLLSQYKDAAEFTIECNPAQADETMLKQLRALGANRLSIGAQSFNADELKTLGRIHSPKQIAEAVRTGKAAGFENIGLDLIFGIPGSIVKDWQFSLECAALDVQHISAYSLTIEKDTPFGRATKAGKLAMIDESTERQMHAAARMFLKDAGFMPYEISNFAKPGFECQHNIRYWKNLPVIGIGPSASGWYRGKRTTNIPDIAAYIEKIESRQFAYTEEHTPTPEQIACETAVLGLRMTDGIDMFEYEKQTGFEFFGLFWNVVKEHCFNGLLECDSTHCRLTEKGLSYADTVSADFTSPG